MAIYRNIMMTFWTDSKVVDEFSPEDKYFYLYLFSNPHTNLCGCYEISKKQVAAEMGYSVETIENLLNRFEVVHKVICYDRQTKEILLVNWSKYNWTTSEKFRKPLLKEINTIKNKQFKEYLLSEYEGRADTVSIPYQYGSDTTDTVSVSININSINELNNKTVNKDIDINKDIKEIKENKKENIKGTQKKLTFGEYKNVKLTDEEFKKLVSEYGSTETDKAIQFLDEYVEMKGVKYKSHYLVMKKWVFDAVKEKEQRSRKAAAGSTNRAAEDLEAFYKMASDWAEREDGK